jgi:hypothetical protein
MGEFAQRFVCTDTGSGCGGWRAEAFCDPGFACSPTAEGEACQRP